MNVKTGIFETMAAELRQKKCDIVVFDAGMIGTVTTSAILRQYQLENRVLYYVDNDPEKWGKNVEAAGGKYPIWPVSKLEERGSDTFVVLLTTSRFTEALSQLEAMDCMKNITCYCIPAMCINSFKTSEASLVRKDTETPIIPKIIHYVWLGGNTIPQPLQYCIDSWKRFCPDYEIKCWNEDNYDINKHAYMQQAYKHKMYGFVPDYMRLDILYQYGGIYLDTDVELVRGLDDLLYQEAFCSVEKWQTINFGGGGGAVKGSRAIKALLEERRNISFINADGCMNKNTCGYYDTLTLEKYGYEINGRVQNILGMNVYPYEFFHPYDYMSGRTERTANTHGIHHFNGGWLDDSMKEANRRAREEFDRINREAG